MEKLRTSLTIIRHSLGVMVQHPRLLVFPAIGTVAALVVYIFFLAPLLFDTTLAEIWYRLRLPDESWDVIAPWRAESEAAGSLWQRHFAAYAGYYLIAMFTMNFVNVALYSQIIEAMNGGRVSVARGFAVACSKLRAIVAWSIMAGAVGAILRALQERLGLPGKWIAAFAGLTWSAASVFVIPVIINEPKSRSPLDYVRISTALVKRVWGEGVAGIGGLALVYVLMVVVLVVLSMGMASVGDGHAMQVATVLSVAAGVTFYVLYLGWQIFECGLYVYATEGVAPGTFNDEVFDRVWILKSSAASAAESRPARRVPWTAIIRVLPLALAAVPVWLHFFPLHYTRLEHPQSYIGVVTVDLAATGYKFGIEDLRGAGLFLEGKPGKDLFVEGSFDKFFTGESDAGLQPEMYKSRNQLLVHFYGEDAVAGAERIRRATRVLQSRFPGHEGAIEFKPFVPGPRRTTVISWPVIPGATSYGLDIDCFDCMDCPRSWCADAGSQWKTVTNLSSRTYTFDWAGPHPGRVRIWGVNTNGRRGLKSPWTDFDYKW